MVLDNGKNTLEKGIGLNSEIECIARDWELLKTFLDGNEEEVAMAYEHMSEFFDDKELVNSKAKPLKTIVLDSKSVKSLKSDLRKLFLTNRFWIETVNAVSSEKIEQEQVEEGSDLSTMRWVLEEFENMQLVKAMSYNEIAELKWFSVSGKKVTFSLAEKDNPRNYHTTSTTKLKFKKDWQWDILFCSFINNQLSKFLSEDKRKSNFYNPRQVYDYMKNILSDQGYELILDIPRSEKFRMKEIVSPFNKIARYFPKTKSYIEDLDEKEAMKMSKSCIDIIEHFQTSSLWFRTKKIQPEVKWFNSKIERGSHYMKLQNWIQPTEYKDELLISLSLKDMWMKWSRSFTNTILLDKGAKLNSKDFERNKFRPSSSTLAWKFKRIPGFKKLAALAIRWNENRKIEDHEYWTKPMLMFIGYLAWYSKVNVVASWAKLK